MDDHPSLTWLAPGCEPLAEGACFCPAIANRLVPFCEVPGCSCGQVVEQELWLKTAIHIFPSTNKTDRSWFVKLNLCRKVDLSVKERGVWEPSAHPFVLGKFMVGRSSRESLSDIPRGTFFCCCCPEVKPENALDSVAAPSMGMQLFLLVSWVCSFPLACSPL